MNSHVSTGGGLRPFLIAAAFLGLLFFPGLIFLQIFGASGLLFRSYSFCCLAATVSLALFGLKLLQGHGATSTRYGSIFFLALAFLFIVNVGIAAYLPVISRDALIHHLAVPSLWIQHGSAYQIDWHVWSYYPMLIQTIFTGLLPTGEWLCVVFHATFLVLSGELVALVWLRWRPEQDLSAVVPGALLLLTPVCLSLAATPLVDLALTFFCGAVIGVFFLPGLQRENGVLAGIFLGCALSTKYNALIFAFCIFLLAPLLFKKKNARFSEVIVAILIFAFTSLIVFSPWLIKNALYTGNPLYPLLGGIFGSSSGGYSMGSVGPLEKRMYLYGESGIAVLLLPIRMLLFGEEGNPRLFDGVASPLYLLAAIPLFGLFKQKSEVSSEAKVPVFALYGILLLYTLCSLCYGPARVRYMAPVYCLLALLTTEGIRRIAFFRSGMRISGLVAPLLLLLHSFWGIYFSPLPENISFLSSMQKGLVERDAYRSRHVEFDLIQEVNRRVPRDKCTLLLYTSNAFYWYRGCARSSGYNSGTAILGAIKKSKSEAGIYNYFLNEKIEYLFLHTDRIRRIFTENLSQEEQHRWAQFADVSLELVFSKRGYALWRIRTPEELNAIPLKRKAEREPVLSGEAGSK